MRRSLRRRSRASRRQKTMSWGRHPTREFQPRLSFECHKSRRVSAARSSHLNSLHKIDQDAQNSQIKSSQDTARLSIHQPSRLHMSARARALSKHNKPKNLARFVVVSRCRRLWSSIVVGRQPQQQQVASMAACRHDAQRATAGVSSSCL